MRNKLLLLLLAALPAFAQGPSYPYTVSLNWVLSSTPIAQISGQNIYRAQFGSTSCPSVFSGNYTKLTSSLLSNTQTTFVDGTMPPGFEYCYSVSAMGTDGAESAGTIPTTAIIPPAPPTNPTATVAMQIGGKENVTVAWTPSASPGILSNQVLVGMKTGGPYNLLQVSLPAGTNSATYKNAPKETVFAVVTATSRMGQSGKSKEMKIVIP